MEKSIFLKYLPLVFKVGTSLDIHTGELNKILISCRFLTGFSLSILTLHNMTKEESGEGKYARVHDLLIIIILALSEAAFIQVKENALILIRYLMKPTLYESKTMPLELNRAFLRMVNIFGSVVTGVFTGSFFWSFTPLLSIVVPDRNSTTTFHFPLHWIPNSSESFISVFIVTTASLFYVVSGIIHFFAWYPIMAYSAIRMKLMVRLLAFDVELLDFRAKHLSEKALTNIVSAGRLPFCKICRNAPEKVNVKSLVNEEELVAGKVIKLWKFDPRECCESACKEKLEELYLNRLWGMVVKSHTEIIRFVRLVNKSFQLSILMYNQFAVVAAVLLIPKVSNVQSITGTEVMIVAFEVLGVLSTVAIFNYCGQIILNESESIRKTLYNYRWHDKPRSTKRSVLIMLTVSTKPPRLTSGGIHTLSNETYSTILSAAYSYASVLQSLKANNK